MPELPEVETFVKSLTSGGMTGPSILSRPVSFASLYWRKSLEAADVGDFESWFAGKSFESAARRGKYLKLKIADRTLLIHLRMSGDLKTVPADSEIGKHDRFALTFSDGERLVFRDPRKFGRLWLLRDPEVVFAKLGVEPLSDEFTPDVLCAGLAKTNRPVKTVLLDQSFIAGLGNIYTDEALFRAGIHPLTPGAALVKTAPERVGRLWNTIRGVLREGIRNNGASFDWVYRGGDFQNHFNVYGKKGEPCPICGAPIERAVVGQRGTHFCPNCQPVAVGKI